MNLNNQLNIHLTKEEIKEIQEENKKLREQINSLRQFENILDMENDIFVVGKGSRRFYAYLLDLHIKLSRLDQKKK